MATEKELKSRLLQKHDTEENWNKAVNFIPKAGEIIVYDDTIPKIKIGDGVKTVTNLNYASNIFVLSTEDDIDYNNVRDKINKGLSVYIYLPTGDLLPFIGFEGTGNTSNIRFSGSVTPLNSIDYVLTISSDNTLTVTYKASAPIVLTTEMNESGMAGTFTDDILVDIVTEMLSYPTPPVVFIKVGDALLPVLDTSDPTQLIAMFEEVSEDYVAQISVVGNLISKTFTVASSSFNMPTKDSLGLSNVENKSSATIRDELTKANVVAALGYTPPEQDTKVTQANTTTNSNYNVLLSYGAASTSSVTNTVKKSANLQFNPSTKTLTVANLAGNATSSDAINWGTW